MPGDRAKRARVAAGGPVPAEEWLSNAGSLTGMLGSAETHPDPGDVAATVAVAAVDLLTTARALLRLLEATGVDVKGSLAAFDTIVHTYGTVSAVIDQRLVELPASEIATLRRDFEERVRADARKLSVLTGDALRNDRAAVLDLAESEGADRTEMAEAMGMEHPESVSRLRNHGKRGTVGGMALAQQLAIQARTKQK